MPTKRLLTLTTTPAKDNFTLTGVTGREELSRPFSFQLELVAELSTTVAPADLVGQPIGWSVAYPDEAPRLFHGVVRSLAAGEVVGRTRRVYRAEVVPWLWFLTRTADCKIFQNKSVSEIAEAVFGAFGLSDYELNLTGTYQPREYCVQYRETAFDFVSRLLEEEGIFYFFKFEEAKHTLVLADAASAYFDCDPHTSPEYRPEAPDAEAVHSWGRRYEFRSGKYAHTDYNFETPATNLLGSVNTTVQLTNISKYELFDYPGGHSKTAAGNGRATVRMQEVEVGYETAVGAGRCSSFMPGGKFALANHALDDQPVVLTAVEHTASEPLTAGVAGSSGDYRNTFTAIPASVVFRPERLTRRPVVEGPQTAVVVGPSGEEIYTDKYGRIKVHFHWDRYGQKNENDTCWVRVGELWAGKNWGMIFTPRIGQEVVVDFLEGDPDRPIVTGRVYNAEQMPPYALPANMTQSGIKTRSTKGGGTDDFNELRFEDKKGSEDIYFHAQKDFHRVVENDDDLKVGHDQTVTIKNNRTLTVNDGFEKITIETGDRERTVSKGNDTLTVSKGNRTVTVTEGDLSTTVGNNYSLVVDKGNHAVQVKQGNATLAVDTGNREVTVKTGNDTHTVKTGNREVTVELGNDTLTVKTGNHAVKVDLGSSTTEAMQGITLKVGSNHIKIDQSGVSIQGMTVKIEGTVETKISGLTTTVDGSAMTKVSGGVVMVN